MCGITGIYVRERGKGKFPTDRLFDALLQGIEYRGQDASGFLSVGFQGNITLDKDPLPASVFVHTRTEFDPESTKVVLGHTRAQTQGSHKNNLNNHPVVWGTCFAIHNGHISNDDDVIKDAEIEVRPAEVDSIAIPIALNQCGLDTPENVRKGLEMLQGGMAIAAIDPVRDADRLILAKGRTSPLIVLNHPDVIIWSSFRPAIEDAWKAIIGTPPKHDRYRRPNDGKEMGWYDLDFGDFWVIDEDRIEAHRFQPKGHITSYGSYGSQGAFPNWCNETQRWYRLSKKFTCTPTGRECQHPCDEGCLTVKCTCTKFERVYQPESWGVNYRLPHTRTDPLPDNVTDLQSYREWREEENIADEALLKCDGCYEWFKINDLETVRFSEGGIYDLCEDCRDDTYFGGSSSSGVVEDAAARNDSLRKRDSILKAEADRQLDISTVDNDYIELSGEEVRVAIEQRRRWMRLAEKYDRLHQSACRKIADDNDSTTEYVEWLLFECELEVLDESPELKEERDKFDTQYAELVDGIKIGEGDE